jgi:hypothetical protein
MLKGFQRMLEAQVIEILGHNRLTDEILRAGLEVAHPARDRGIDLIAYADIDTKVRSFVARPIQMKAASVRSFSINFKYAKFPNLLLAFVWNLGGTPDQIETFALSYQEAFDVASAMGYVATPSWQTGSYTTTNPGTRLRGLLEPYAMSSTRWWDRVVKGI